MPALDGAFEGWSKPLAIFGESQHAFSVLISNDSPIRRYRGKPKA